MSCNPAIGGIGKGHLTKEIDALGGAMARAIDRAGIHFRILNASKGPAVRATRAQADRALYKRVIRELLDEEPNLTLLQQNAEGLLLDGTRVRGVVTQTGIKIAARAVVLTVGTFLDGKIHVGQVNYSGGRAGDPASIGLARGLRDLGLAVGRLKTGTPPRIDGRTIDYTSLAVAARRRAGARVLVPRPPRGAPSPGVVPHHAHDRAHARDHSRGARPLAALHRRDRGRRPALLPVDRGQGGALRGPARGTRSSSSPRGSTRSRSIRTGSRPRCRSTCSSTSCARSRASRTRT